MRRLIVSPRAQSRGQHLIHWRYIVYQRLIGASGMRSYRLWLWSHAAGFRELNRRKKLLR